MRQFIAGLLLAAAMQPAISAPTAPADLFDFWVGDWVLTWNKPDGSPVKARNRITKILDGQVIEENFEGDPALPQRLLGRSLSVRDKQGVWHQAWVDNQGGYLSMTGSVEGGSRYFSTAFQQAGEQSKGQRMRFYDIKPDSFMWDWEGSSDGGRTWTLIWRIQYQRVPGG